MINSTILKDKTFLIGVGLFALSLLIFLFTDGRFLARSNNYDEIFFANYPIFIGYFIIVGIANRKQFGGWFRFRNRSYNVLLMLLFNLSAYALNRTVPVFQDSTPWLIGFLMTLNAAMLLYCVRDSNKPDGFNYGLVFIFSAALLFNIYEAIYIFELYPISVMICWFFGISVHSFVPLMWVFLLGRILYEYLSKHAGYWQPVIAGWVIPIAVIAWFCVEWTGVQNTVWRHIIKNNEKVKIEQDLPRWVSLSQELENDWVTKRALKSGLVYSIVKENRRIGWLPEESRWLNERTQHDPLVVIASALVGNVKLDPQEKVKQYKTLFNERHQTERRLWSGNHLSTDHIETTVQLFPEHRVAYTEKVIQIKHSGLNTSRWRGSTQEAIYSFYLPEGSVVTSASLWVDGTERPAYLTTKSKADSAYTTIVGRERRDPLVIHWAEGNRVSARVFPVREDLPRQFKIGITTPLAEMDGQLIYQNIDFEGPEWLDASENVTVLTEGQTENMIAPWGLHQEESSWKYAGEYLSEWSLRFDAPPLATDAFSFNGRRLQLEKYTPELATFQPKRIYLDINKSWTIADFEAVMASYPNVEKIVYQQGFHTIDKTNQDYWFKELHAFNFSLFPLYKITDPATALVITASGRNTPTLKDIKKSVFARKTGKFLLNNPPTRVLHLGQILSPYWSALAEVDAVQMMRGDTKKNLQYADNQEFIVNQENENTVVLSASQLKIVETSGEAVTNTTAPDHLLRLFAYNDLLQAVGRNYFKPNYLEKALIQQADEAYIVSPISSLIVLETQEDYERFDIKKSNNSLDNAAIKQSGAVPEPEEWLLIILSLGVLLFLWFKKID